MSSRSTRSMKDRARIGVLLIAAALMPACGPATPPPMRLASALGRTETARLYLENRPDLPLKERIQYMKVAAAWGQSESVRFWIENGCHERAALGSALISAAMYGRAGTTRMLLELGADPNHRNLRLRPIDGMFFVASGRAGTPGFDEEHTGEPRDYVRTLVALNHAGADPRGVLAEYLQDAAALGHDALVAAHRQIVRDWVAARRRERPAAEPGGPDI